MEQSEVVITNEQELEESFKRSIANAYEHMKYEGWNNGQVVFLMWESGNTRCMLCNPTEGVKSYGKYASATATGVGLSSQNVALLNAIGAFIRREFH